MGNSKTSLSNLNKTQINNNNNNNTRNRAQTAPNDLSRKKSILIKKSRKSIYSSDSNVFKFDSVKFIQKSFDFDLKIEEKNLKQINSTIKTQTFPIKFEEENQKVDNMDSKLLFSNTFGMTVALAPKTKPIYEDYIISKDVLGMGISGKVLSCTHKQTKVKYALKVSFDFFLLEINVNSLCLYIVQIIDFTRISES
jgi:hypothetical protein